MIKGKVTAIEGSTLHIKTSEDTETSVSAFKGSTRITVIPVGGKRQDAKPGYLTDIQNGDTVEAGGANPARLDSITVTKGTVADVKEVVEFNDKKRVVPVSVTAPKAPEPEIHTLPAERLTSAEQAPADVPYGKRRAWREKQAKVEAKELGGKTVKQTKDTSAASEDAADDGEENLEEYTNEDLRALAHKEDINLHGASTKDEIIKAIKKGRKDAAKATA